MWLQCTGVGRGHVETPFPAHHKVVPKLLEAQGPGEPAGVILSFPSLMYWGAHEQSLLAHLCPRGTNMVVVRRKQAASLQSRSNNLVSHSMPMEISSSVQGLTAPAPTAPSKSRLGTLSPLPWGCLSWSWLSFFFYARERGIQNMAREISLQNTLCCVRTGCWCYCMVRLAW